VQLFERSCDGGSLMGCRALGLLYSDGRAVQKDEQKARSYLERGCALGDSIACERLRTPARPGRD